MEIFLIARLQLIDNTCLQCLRLVFHVDRSLNLLNASLHPLENQYTLII
jgi:hypothetical protein